jgi:hypothetical protein
MCGRVGGQEAGLFLFAFSYSCSHSVTEWAWTGQMDGEGQADRQTV